MQRSTELSDEVIEGGHNWVLFCDSYVQLSSWKDLTKHFGGEESKRNVVYLCFYRMMDVGLWKSVGLL